MLNNDVFNIVIMLTKQSGLTFVLRYLLF